MTTIRRPGAASVAVLLGLSASLATAHAVAPDWSRHAGLDVWNLSALQEEYRVAIEERAEMRSRAERAIARRSAGNQITGKLIANAIALPVAADELSEVFHQDTGAQSVLKAMYPEAPSERHLFARHAIDRVKAILVDDPVQRTAVLARLEIEYRAMCVPPESPHAP
jgi:hypothetical protein